MIGLIFLGVCLLIKLYSQALLIQQLNSEKKLWEFIKDHVEFRDDRDCVVLDRHNVVAVGNERRLSNKGTNSSD